MVSIRAKPRIFPEFDGIVGTSGRVNYVTLQAADDVLDAAAYSLFVKQGTYAAGLTVSTNNVYIFVEPGTVIQAAIVLSGSNITLVLGAGCDVQGLITLSGANCSLICQNGVDIDGILVSGNFGYVDGGGWETISDGGTTVDAIATTGTDCLVRNIAVQTTAGQGNTLRGVDADGVRTRLDYVKVIDSDSAAFDVRGDDSYMTNCLSLNSDEEGVYWDGFRGQIIGNYILNGGDGIAIGAVGDDTVINGNTVKDQSAQSIDIAAAAENCVFVGNRLDGAAADNSGTSTPLTSTDVNDETAF